MLESISVSIRESKPICLVGGPKSGKQTALQMIARHVLKMETFTFNPELAGSFRELYGVYDPVSVSQQVQSSQVGPVEYPIVETLLKVV